LAAHVATHVLEAILLVVEGRAEVNVRYVFKL
jgi:predicted fused transcriptional regulator/phosphomethylpyrimidine kinase